MLDRTNIVNNINLIGLMFIIIVLISTIQILPIAKSSPNYTRNKSIDIGTKNLPKSQLIICPTARREPCQPHTAGSCTTTSDCPPGYTCKSACKDVDWICLYSSSTGCATCVKIAAATVGHPIVFAFVSALCGTVCVQLFIRCCTSKTHVCYMCEPI